MVIIIKKIFYHIMDNSVIRYLISSNRISMTRLLLRKRAGGRRVC